jgi:hypothetical protein
MMIVCSNRAEEQMVKRFFPEASVVMEGGMLAGIRVRTIMVTDRVNLNSEWFLEQARTRMSGPAPIFVIRPTLPSYEAR